MAWFDKIARFRIFLRQVWHLSAPYFNRSEEKWQARGLLLASIAFNLASVHMAVLLATWQGDFTNALVTKDVAAFRAELWRFSWLITALVLSAIAQFYLAALLSLRWRGWMTRQLTARWLKGKAFYHLELGRYAGPAQPDRQASGLPTPGQRTPDNPDQRLEEDVDRFTEHTVNLSLGLLRSVVTLISFLGMLWGLSGSFEFTLMGSELTIPGFLVWVALLYTGVATVLAHYIGRAMIGLNFEQQRLEGNYRHRLVRVREYSEAIALDNGEATEQRQLDARFALALANKLALLKKEMQLLGFTTLQGQLAFVVPFIVAAPRYLSGAMPFGQLIQISTAFSSVQGALSWLVDNYSALAMWRATTERLTTFEAALGELEMTGAGVQRTESASPGQAIEARELTLQLPTGATLLQGATVRAAPGEHTLIQGPSGSGKSTLLRALVGIWPWAQGQAALPAGLVVIPQRPYIPDGSLRDALAYPEPADRYSDAQLRTALADALLPTFADRLDEEENWTQKLSGGEQQRLAIARAMLKQPAWVLADEATAALDVPTEETLYQRLKTLTEQRGGAMISIAHRPTVAPFHSHRWRFEPLPEGAPARFRMAAGAA